LYFHKAPNAEEFHQETVTKLQTLHQFDCLRANKSTSAWGVEARVPFLDKSVLAEAMSIDAVDKMAGSYPGGARIEKWILRKAFDDAENPYLPEKILWRQKEQFSDGVGYGWIDALRDLAENAVSDEQMSGAAERFAINPPANKEAYHYRQMFNQHFASDSAQRSVPGGLSIACSTAKAIEWDEAFKASADPSGRAIAGVHAAAYK
jgi:asparagine synthase (glutamine-hydrolysing)